LPLVLFCRRWNSLQVRPVLLHGIPLLPVALSGFGLHHARVHLGTIFLSCCLIAGSAPGVLSRLHRFLFKRSASSTHGSRPNPGPCTKDGFLPPAAPARPCDFLLHQEGQALSPRSRSALQATSGFWSSASILVAVLRFLLCCDAGNGIVLMLPDQKA
jgi:hypothetical protein